jgi:hypothetical protein
MMKRILENVAQGVQPNRPRPIGATVASGLASGIHFPFTLNERIVGFTNARE